MVSDALVDGLAAQAEQLAQSEKFSECRRRAAPWASSPRGCARARGAGWRRRSRSSRCGRTRVEGLAQRPVRGHQVVRAELDQFGELGADAHEAGVRAGAALAVGAAARSRARADRPVDAARRGGQHLGVDVAGEDARAGGGTPASRPPSSRSSRAPRRWRRRCTRCAGWHAARLQVVGEGVEVMLLAEEGREVGGQAVDELLPLASPLAPPFVSSHCR